MHKFANVGCVALLLIELLVTGCARKPNPDELLRLAVRSSNEEAVRRFQVAPFGPDDGQVRSVADGFLWEGLTSASGHDMSARVKLNRNGAVLGVDVQMLVHPGVEPFTNLPPLSVPPGERRPSPIPEVLPK